MAAGRGVPGDPAPQQRGALPAAAGAGRGAQVRHRLPSGQARQGRHRQRARRRARAGPGPAQGPAQAVRFGTQAHRGERGGNRRGARHRPPAGRHHLGGAGPGGRPPGIPPIPGGNRSPRTPSAPRAPLGRNAMRTADDSADIVIITGLSGAGRSTAAKSLEDLGWFVVDNLPPGLLTTMVDLAARSNGAVSRMAAVVDVRSRAFSTDLKSAISDLGARGATARVVYLEAAEDTLVRRFDSERRPHPLQGNGRVTDGLAAERELLREARGDADLVLDTTRLNVHELRARMRDFFGGGTAAGLRLSIVSFGYKYGLPVDADLVADCRFLPNPHWIPELAPMTGQDEPVREYILSQPGAKEFLRHYAELLHVVLPGYEREGKRFVTLAVGCTGGKHRSVAIADEMAARVAGSLGAGANVQVVHRDLGRE